MGQMTLHLKGFTLHPDAYPTQAAYPFKLPVFQQTKSLVFDTPVTLFVGENGTGKSTLLEALAQASVIYIWRPPEGRRVEVNHFADMLCRFIELDWVNGRVPGSYFGSDNFRYFSEALDEWAANDPGQLKYFGGKSLVTQSHGQSLMSYFRSRYQIRGLYFLDEPETALSPRSQLELLDILHTASQAGLAQFILATHSPILLACNDARIFSFDHIPVVSIAYEQTDHFRIYRDFFVKRSIGNGDSNSI
jgi:predicted ATPase